MPIDHHATALASFVPVARLATCGLIPDHGPDGAHTNLVFGGTLRGIVKAPFLKRSMNDAQVRSSAVPSSPAGEPRPADTAVFPVCPGLVSSHQHAEIETFRARADSLVTLAALPARVIRVNRTRGLARVLDRVGARPGREGHQCHRPPHTHAHSLPDLAPARRSPRSRPSTGRRCGQRGGYSRREKDADIDRSGL